MNDLSPIRMQDAATDLQDDELFNGAYYTQQAHDLFVQARAVRHEPHMRDHYHRQAMEQLDKLAEALSLELVVKADAPADVVMGR